jgi:hypothetical protein
MVARTTRWESLSDREIGALIGALEAADREGSIDHVGKALQAELEAKLALRLRRTDT